MKKITIKSNIHQQEAVEIIKRLPLDGSWTITFKESSIRNLEQNALMWALLHEISRQVIWYGNKLTDEEWKIVFSAALHKSKIVPDLDGTGFVSIGSRTSTMTLKEMSELIELMTAFGVEHNVKFSARR